MSRRFLIPILVFLVAGVSLQLVNQRVDRVRVELGIGHTSGSSVGVPPDLALIHTLLGGFRAWVINYLWIRASHLQDRGRIHEAAQLAEWISELSPRFDRVWSFQAYNLVYDVSQYAPTAQEGWVWVESGLDLVRSRGLRFNPLSWTLHQDLTFWFWSKIGTDTDPHAWYYRERLIVKWERILGAACRDEAALRKVAGSPFRARELNEQFPELEGKVGELLESLPQSRFWDSMDLGSWARDWLDERAPDFDSTNFEALIDCLRGYLLRQWFAMDPALMLALVRDFGPFDWRHHASHAAYWTLQGRLRALTLRADVRFERSDPILTELYRRDINFLSAIEQLLLRGRLRFDEERSGWISIPELEWRPLYRELRLGGLDFEEESTEVYKTKCCELLWLSYLAFGPSATEPLYQTLKAEFTDLDPLEGVVEKFLKALASSSEKPLVARFYCEYLFGWARFGKSAAEELEALNRVPLESVREGQSGVDFAALESDALSLYFLTPDSITAKGFVWRRASPAILKGLELATLRELEYLCQFYKVSIEEHFPGLKERLYGR